MLKFSRIHAALPVAVALLGGVALLSQPGHARALDQSAAEEAPAAVRLAQGDKADGKKDLESLEGTWNIDTIEWGDKSLPKELMKGYKFVFAGNKLTWDAAIGMMSKGGKISAIDGAYPCDFKIDPSKKPKEIDITMHSKQGDRTILGIYEIKGDALKVCYYSSQTGKRPTEFSSKDDRRIGCITLTRAKKSDKSPPE